MSIKLATARFCGKSSHETFLEVQKKCYFTSKLLVNQSYVTPYVIITDGKDIIVQKNSNSMDIGLPFEVQKIHKGVAIKFEEDVEESILNNLWNRWKNIKVMEKVPSNIEYDTNSQRISKFGVKYRDLDKSEIRIHCTETGFYGFNNKHYHPIYFLMIPEDHTISFTSQKSAKYLSASLAPIVQLSEHLSLSYASTHVVKLFRSGEIMAPNISNPKDE